MRVVFCLPDGNGRSVEAPVGSTILEAARRGGVAIEGACGGSMACATCHVIFEDADFERLSDPALEEDEMLDLAAEVTATSRLGCQIRLAPEHENLHVHVPKSTLVDG